MLDITVIVPCYNSGRYLAKCIDSLVSQSVELKEILIINDGSTDDTLEIAEEYQKIYKNINIISKENAGLPQARATGVKYAVGQYLGFVDSDDWASHDMYEKLYNEISVNKADIAACGYMTCDENNKQAKVIGSKKNSVVSSEEALQIIHCRTGVFTFMCNKLYKKKLFDDVVFPEGNFIGEDYITNIQIFSRDLKVAWIQDPLYYYFQSSNSMSRGGFNKSYYISMEQYKKAEIFLNNKQPNQKAFVSCYLAVEYLSFVVAMAKNKKYDYAIIKYIKKYLCKNLSCIIKNKEFSFLYKLCVFVMIIDYRFLIFMYRLKTRNKVLRKLFK